MNQYVASFTTHLQDALSIGRSNSFTPQHTSFQNIIITGLGGSGIGGKIVAQLIGDSCKVPVYVNNDYVLPAFVSENTLVIASSYSGNTEETLISVEQALKAGATVYCVSSGGKLIDLAKEKGLGHTIIPGGFPPRAAFGYSFPQLFFVLEKFGFINNSFDNSIERTIALLNAAEEDIKNEALKIAEQIHGKTPVIYSEAKFEGVAVRFRQQINENSKVLCWHHVLPEMNHNELVGWAGANEQFAVLMLNNESDFYRTKERFKFSKNIFSQYTSTIIDIHSQGDNDLMRSLYLIHLTDWISCYLADLRGVDSIEVNVIVSLKSKLAQF